jgi:hypothetical protein
MSDIVNLLNNSIYPSIYARAITIFPEFEFKPTTKGYYVSTNQLKITGEVGNKRGGVYYYENNQGHLIDYTRDHISIWDYIQKRDNIGPNREVLERLAELGGVALPELSKEDSEKWETQKKRTVVYEKVQEYFKATLEKQDEKSEIKKYIKDR